VAEATPERSIVCELHLGLPVTSGAPREFFKVRSVDPVFGRP
jgi:hypothetical protein